MSNNKKINICQFTSVYFNNIGNAFIDIGTEFIIRSVINENYDFVKVSQCANFAASLGKLFILKEIPFFNYIWNKIKTDKIHDNVYRTIKPQITFSTAAMFDFDYFIIPGCVLTVPFFTKYLNLLLDKTKQGTKIIFLGASGNHYSNYETEFVTKALRELQPLAICVRDPIACEKYSQYTKNFYDGIDNAFFVNRLDIPHLDSTFKPFVVINIEELAHAGIKEQVIKQLKESDKTFVFTDHKPYPLSKISKLTKKGNIIISDYPLDYLTVYKNAEIVYSDRVHACIPTLSFGNKAILYTDSPRKELFTNAGGECNICMKNEMQFEEYALLQRQEKQIAWLRNVIQQTIN